MRICVIGLRGIPDVIGGIGTVCQRLYPVITELEPNKKITLIIRRGYAEAERFRYRHIDVLALWSPSIWGVDTLVHTLWALLYARIVLSPDLVHIHGIGPALFSPIARLLGLTIVVTHHAPDYLRPKWDWRGRLVLQLGEYFAAVFAHTVICVSDAVRNKFLERYCFASARTIVIRNGVSREETLSPARTDVLSELGLSAQSYILAVGRLEQTKAFDVLIAAYKQLERCSLKLVIVGSAAGNDHHAGELWSHCSETIIFAGFRTYEDLRALYASTALFVHPSRMEGYGLDVAEALAVGAPVIVSDIPPHREFDLHPRCYVPAGDVDALAAALAVPDLDIYRQPSAMNERQLNAWEAVAREHIELFNRAVRPKSSEA